MLFVTSIKQVLSKNFIVGLGQNTTTGSIVDSIRGGGKSDAQKVSLGLRRGAGLYAKAIGKLNAVGTVLNTSKALLNDLSEITDKMTTIVTRATKASTTNSTRSRLDREFKGLVTEFRDIIENAKVDDKEILTKDGLIEFFTNVGLDPEKSSKIANVFEKFVVPKEEDLFASEEVKGAALKLPAAENAPTPSPTYFMNQVTNSSGTITVGGIMTGYNIFSDTADYLSQNPDNTITPFIMGEDGNLVSVPGSPQPTKDIAILAVSENSGYSIIRSSDDLLGYNAGGIETLYLMAPDGTVLHQLSVDDATDFSSVDIAYTPGAGKMYVTFVSNQNLDGSSNPDLGSEVFYYEIQESSFGSDPSSDPPGLAQITSGSGTAVSGAVKISEDGSYIAFNYVDGGVAQIRMYERATGNTGTLNNVSRVVGFLDSDTIVTAGATRFNYINYATPALTNNVLYVPEGGSMPGTTQVAVSENGYLGYYAPGNYNVYLVDVSAGNTTAETLVKTLDSTDTVDYLTIAANSGSTADVGIYGIVREFDSTYEQLYRIREIQANTGDVLSKPTTVDKIFDGNIRRREDAFRTLNDLKALKDQIKDNLEAVDEALDYLQQNIDLVRATGLAFLDLSDKIDTDQEAEDVARLVEQEIRFTAPADALKHAENLSPIVVAALVSTDDS